jgi:hypothetical protein
MNSNICPKCLEVAPICEVAGCLEYAEWEGWYRCLDPLMRTPTGLIRIMNVCNAHRCFLIGGKK